ncbi:MAG: hydroxymethylglutaryl-CoA synthase [Candidatus Marsarchaeota archaeon]|nr:hydroxymethylglutaryl-CoA synthase [Candidatus Marsarchaeota archaeon]MCL5413325.1 hydroxymethylglutaryl-CoA synthase [Candidatus Marsarchaeota archaeon]
MTAGIVGYGVHIPIYRIRVEDIARVWNEDAESIKKGLGIKEKSVPGRDEDAATIAVEAARRAVRHAGIDAHSIGAIYVGSESHPYAVKPTATIVSAALEAGNRLMAADLEFACKAGTAGLQMVMGLIDSGMIKYGMSIGSDTSQGRPGDALEYTASAGGGAFILGREKNEIIADIIKTVSFTSDTPDFWRREGAGFPSHGGRFTGEPGYFRHIVHATKMLFEETGFKNSDFDYAVFHQPNGKFPIGVAAQLGFTDAQIKNGLLTPIIGNTYSGASMIGLAATLDVARPGQKILVTSFGSGAGSDSFAIEVTDNIESKRKNLEKVMDIVNKDRTYIDYSVYLKNRNSIRKT